MSFSEEVYRDQLYTEHQSRILVNVPRLTGSLSILGSVTIVYIILKDWRKKLRRVYHRLLLSYSLIDTVCSLNYALSSAVVPESAPGVWGALGTVATCEISGFIMHFSFSVGLYGSFLCVYYVLVLRYHILERTLARTIEPAVHATAILYPVVMGSIALHKDLYNPGSDSVGWCFLNSYPMDCLRNEDIPCERGADYELWYKAHVACFRVFFIAVVISVLLTVHTVRSMELRGRQWTTSNRHSRVRIRETATQAFLYIASFFITYVGVKIADVLGGSPTIENRDFYFRTTLLTKIFLPIQGFSNFLIYVRPRYSEIRRRRPEMPRLSVLYGIVSGAEVLNLGRTPKSLQTSRCCLDGTGKSSTTNGISALMNLDPSDIPSFTKNRDFVSDQESLDEPDDFFTPEMQTSSFPEKGQGVLTLDCPDAMDLFEESAAGEADDALTTTSNQDSIEDGKCSRTGHSSTSTGNEEA